MGAMLAVPAAAALLYLYTRKPTRDGRAIAEEAKRTVKTREQLAKEARQALPGFNLDKHNIAICGPSRSGKSSLVNVLRGVAEGDADAAKVGEVECTMDITSYLIRDSHLVVWDLPGCSTENHPFEGYFEDKHLYAFDIVLLVYKDGLNEHVAKLYRQCVERQVSVLLVRTQADTALDAKRRRKRSTPIAAIQAEMRQEFLGELEKLGLTDCKDAFYVSAWNMADGKCEMDEHRFINTMVYYGGQRAEAGWNAQEFIGRFYNPKD